MDVEKLIRRLRNDADAYRNGETLGRAFADQEDVLDNAATALSTLQAENEKLRDELEKAMRERDAARSDIETALAYGMKDCELCKNSQCYVRGGTKPCLPKWRGQKEE